MTKKSLTQPDPNNRRRVISLLVDNQSGVLARVSGLFNRRGFNIYSLTVSTTNDPGVSRITLTTHGSDREIEQLILQTERLEELLVYDEEDVELLYGDLAAHADFQLLKRVVLDGCTMLEAAQERGITVEACKKRIQRLRAHLKRKLSDP